MAAAVAAAAVAAAAEAACSGGCGGSGTGSQQRLDWSLRYTGRVTPHTVNTTAVPVQREHIHTHRMWRGCWRLDAVSCNAPALRRHQRADNAPALRTHARSIATTLMADERGHCAKLQAKAICMCACSSTS
jgi:hypothetical protein